MQPYFPAGVLLRRIRQQIRRAQARTIVARKCGAAARPAFSQQYPAVSEGLPAPCIRRMAPARLSFGFAPSDGDDRPRPATGSPAGPPGGRLGRTPEAVDPRAAGRRGGGEL